MIPMTMMTNAHDDQDNGDSDGDNNQSFTYSHSRAALRTSISSVFRRHTTEEVMPEP